MMDSIATSVVALAMVLSALFVVRAKNLVHAVLWLGISLAATAAFYGMQGASFLAGVQILTYVGGIVTLMIFGVMVTRRHEGSSVPSGHKNGFRALLTSLLFFGALAAAVQKTPLEPRPGAALQTTPELARALIDDYVLPFEVASLLLLAGIVGAVVIARRKDLETPATAEGRRAAMAEAHAARLAAMVTKETA